MLPSRERVLAAIERRPTDALPVGFKASIDIMDRLHAHFGTRDEVALIEQLPVDTFGVFENCLPGVFPAYRGGPERVIWPDTYADGTWDTFYGYKRRWVPCPGGRYSEAVTRPLEHIDTVEGVEAYPWPQADWFDYTDIRAQCDRCGDLAIVLLGGSVWQLSNMMGLERVLIDMALNPTLIDRCFEKLADFICAFTQRTLAAAGGRIDVVCIQDDFGTQTNQLISHEMYRRFFQRHHRRIFEIAHQGGAKAMLHSCGAVSAFIPDFIEIGVDVLDPIQTAAEGMDPVRLNKDFGKDICFHGGLDTQGVLLSADPQDVKDAMDGLVRDLGDGGGYILSPAHSLQPDTPFENVLAFLEHVQKWR